MSLSADTTHTTQQTRRRARERAASWVATASAVAAITCGYAASLQATPDPDATDTQREAVTTPTTGDDADTASPTSPTPPKADAPLTQQEERRTIAKPALEQFLDKGIPLTLQQIPMQPVFEKGHLLGYQVKALFPSDPALAARAGIRVGDVILQVNGLSVQRPEDLWSVWEGLRKADRFSVEVLRDGQPLQLSWRVEVADSPRR